MNNVLLTILVALMVASTTISAKNIYHCGNTFQEIPCNGSLIKKKSIESSICEKLLDSKAKDLSVSNKEKRTECQTKKLTTDLDNFIYKVKHKSKWLKQCESKCANESYICTSNFTHLKGLSLCEKVGKACGQVCRSNTATNRLDLKFAKRDVESYKYKIKLEEEQEAFEIAKNARLDDIENDLKKKIDEKDKEINHLRRELSKK